MRHRRTTWSTVCFAALGLLQGGCGSSGDAGAQPHTGPVNHATAFRFLRQATFGPTDEDLALVMDRGIVPWLDAQFAMPSAYDSDRDDHPTHLHRLIEVAEALEPGADWSVSKFDGEGGAEAQIFDGSASSNTDHMQMSVWFENALTGPDQLRQRVAYALSQILVTSADNSQLDLQAEALAHYYDILARNAFGNFRTLLGEVARSPAMGVYLSHQGNEKASADGLTLPDENFARELMQLFTIGLYELNLDGTPRRDAGGALIPTYSQDDVEEMAKVMTGWDLRYNTRYGRMDGSFVQFMEFSPDHHQHEIKQVMGQLIADDGAGGDLEAALDLLFEHPNGGPFLGSQLIQRLVTSNPSPGYVGRVARVYNNNGRGERGDLSSVIRAILLDEEARSPQLIAQASFGKINEPLLAYTALYRAFGSGPVDGWQLNTETGRVPVNGIYWFRVHPLLGQGPLRAPHVFNFYDPDYVPQDAFYRGSDPQRVLPELQLRSPNNIADFFEATQLLAGVLEVNEVRRRNGTLAAYVAERNASGNEDFGNWNGSRAIAWLDYSPALRAFETGMEGDANGDFATINEAEIDGNGETPKQRGLHALLDYLEVKLLGGRPLEAGLRVELAVFLDGDDYFNSGNSQRELEAYRTVSGAIQYVLLSSTNMVQQ